MPTVVYEIIDMATSIFRFIGMGVFGVSVGWLTMDLLKKTKEWPLQAIIYTVLAGLTIAMVVFLPWGALGAFTIGIGVAIIFWGMPRKHKDEDDE